MCVSRLKKVWNVSILSSIHVTGLFKYLTFTCKLCFVLDFNAQFTFIHRRLKCALSYGQKMPCKKLTLFELEVYLKACSFSQPTRDKSIFTFWHSKCFYFIDTNGSNECLPILEGRQASGVGTTRRNWAIAFAWTRIMVHPISYLFSSSTDIKILMH